MTIRACRSKSCLKQVGMDMGLAGYLLAVVKTEGVKGADNLHAHPPHHVLLCEVYMIRLTLCHDFDRSSHEQRMFCCRSIS